MIRKNCLSSLGEHYADQIGFSSDPEQVGTWIQQVWEFKIILTSGLGFPGTDYFDLTHEVRRLRTAGTFIEPEVLFDMRSSLFTITECLRFFRGKNGERLTALSELARDVNVDTRILQKIDAIMDEKGTIRDTASPALKKIRQDLLSRQHQIDRRLQVTLQKAKKEGWISDDTSITIRGGRAVIPVPVTHKRKIHGFIHDESSSGQTVFIEPTDIFDINNEIRELENAERREIIRILTAFTDDIRPQLDSLEDAYQFLGQIDFIRAKAMLATGINGEKPLIKPFPVIRWVQAVHPLLYLAHQRQNKSVVPLTLELDENQRILIISGPNAGGKSICLKTAGLLQYMLQCGLLVPMSEYSQMGIFRQIFIDIGDEQSIDNDLSTYSSHLLNIKYVVEHADRHTLFLIDEFGSGTEPQLGGAIAEATLERLHTMDVFGIVTTHYTNLKLLAGRLPGIVNGAMLFDQERMQPLYRLKTGNPGSSYALEIAQKIGFPAEILENAATKTGKTQLDFDQELHRLELQKEEVARKQTEFRVADEFLAEMISKYSKMIEESEKGRSALFAEAKEKALRIIEDSNRLIEQTIREIRQHQADKEATRDARKRVEKWKEDLEGMAEDSSQQPVLMSPDCVGINSAKSGSAGSSGAKRSPDESRDRREAGPRVHGSSGQREAQGGKEEWKAAGRDLKKGDTVRISGQKVPGEVIDIKGNEVTIAFGSMKVRVAADRLETMAGKLEELISLRPVRSPGSITGEIHSRMAAFRLTIDLRGKRAEEALGDVRKYIDEALLLNIAEVRIIHGKGDGILLQVIRDYLKEVPEVKHFEDEKLEYGGHGVTVVKFR
ncbi:MAG TPA: Smr/MutS family protein [Bacteroidales bacterium]|nr:Smr/MutS family protein [Bacteroidales bacterium]